MTSPHRRRPKKPDDKEPISMWPLEPEDAIEAFLKVDPEAVRKEEEKAKKRREKRKSEDD